MYGHAAARTATIAAVAVLAGASAALASPPDNDNYMAAATLNSPGSSMPTDNISYPVTDVTDATLQADLFAPPTAGGPPEPSACRDTQLGHTVWYRFFPDVDGHIRIQSVGFDTTIALVPFASVQSPLPQGYNCANQRDDTIENLTARVDGGGAYAVQVGGTGSGAGSLQVNFTFVPDRDDDGFNDSVDRCPRRPGTVNGCPPRISATTPYHYDDAPGGEKFTFLDVRGAPAGARVDVRCSRGCPHVRLTVKRRITHIKAFSGRVMPPGARIEVRVTKRGWVGTYIAFTVATGKVDSTTRCLPVGSSKPRKTCK